MNKNKGLLLALGLGLGLGLTGCDDNFLQTVPPDEVSDAVYWTQEKDAVLAVNGLYELNQASRVTIDMSGASDDAWAQKSFDAWYPIGGGVADSNNGDIGDFWYESYTAIRRANEILANIDRIPEMDEALRSRLKGEASYHRAYHYNLLVSLWGDVPLILTPITIEEGKEATRAPKAQVVDQILKDLDFAASVLPVSYGSADYGRATKGAALALKARAALYASRWQDAASAAKAVIDLGVYSLQPNYADLTRYAGDHSPEIIYADQRVQNLRSQGVFGRLAPRSFQDGSDRTPLRGLVDAYEMIDGKSISESPLYDPSKPYANRDPRMYATLLYPGAEFGGKVFNSLPGSGTADEVRNDFNATSTGFQFIRYVDLADKDDRGNSGIDYILIRYADVLLMYAEAKTELGQIDASVYDAINQVRRRAGMPEITSGKSQDQLRQIIRHERRVEFPMEGLRAFDIKRWRIAENVMPGQHYGIDYVDTDGTTKKWLADVRRFDPARDYLWPIPQKEIDLNPGLTQNPGY